MKCLIILLSAFSFSTYAQQTDLSIEEVKFEGLTRTKEYFVKSELGINPGDSVSSADINAGIKNLRNTNLFSNVSHSLSGGENKTLTVKVKERWTTIPILKFSSGGGVGQLTLGAYDPNVLGHFIESGMQYERLGETNSGVLWFKNPRLFGKKQGIDVQAWFTNRVRTKYEQNIEDPVIKAGFLLERKKLYFNYFKEFTPKVKGHFFYEYNEDSFSVDLLDDEVKQKAISFGIPVDTKVNFLGLGFDYGKLNFDSFKVDGFLTELRLRYGLVSTADIKNFTEADFSVFYYKTYKWDVTFAQRFLTGFTTTDILQYWKYLGGLDRVRGFSDNRFAGKYYWLSNTEVRLPIYRHPWAVVQVVSFLDLVNTSDFIDNATNLGGASAGAGLRLFLPKVYRFIVRLDVAQPLKKEDDMRFSFGVQQFF